MGVGRSSRIALALAGMLTCAAGLAAAESSVGFRVLEKRDPSRPLKDSPAGRPIQISLWYPSAPGPESPASPRMLYRDYMILGLSEKSFVPPAPDAIEKMLAEYRKFLGSTGMTEDEADALLTIPMQARRDAPEAGGDFPLILMAPGNSQSADDMAALAEALASHGFRVACVPSPTRISGPMESEADIAAKADEQASDLAFARAAMRGRARPGKIGVVAHSFGARSAVLWAMRDPEIAGVVSLDGGIGSRTGMGTLEKARGFSRERMVAPLLHFYEELDPQMAPDFRLIRSLDHCDRWLVRVSDMHHVHFTSIGALIAASPALTRATSATRETGEASQEVGEATLAFLENFVGSAGSKTSRWRVPAGRDLRTERLPASR